MLNLSGNNPSDADALADLDLAPVSRAGSGSSWPRRRCSRRRPARRQRSAPGRSRRCAGRRSERSCRNSRRTLLAGGVVLPHGRRQPMFELAVELAEPAVAVAVGVCRAVFLPQHGRIDPGALHLADQRGPIGLDPAARPHLGPPAANSRSSRTPSLSSPGNGQVSFAAAARARYSCTVLRLTPSSRLLNEPKLGVRLADCGRSGDCRSFECAVAR
jgi:hypothetical protein